MEQDKSKDSIHAVWGRVWDATERANRLEKELKKEVKQRVEASRLFLAAVAYIVYLWCRYF